MKKLIIDQVLARLLYIGFRLWCMTLSVHLNENINPFKDRSYILTLWHSRIFYIFYFYRQRKDIFLLISPSKDGDLLANVAHLLGYSVIRGSSYKKAVPAARSLIKILRRNQIIFVVADGSRGPRHKAQPGSLQLSSLTGAPVVPMSWDAKSKIELNSWDRFVLPLPFSRISFRIGNPIQVPPDLPAEILQEKQSELENALNCLTFNPV